MKQAVVKNTEHKGIRPINDNDNDTLREVPHRSNEGLALQARVSGPWPHKKESVSQVKLALLARCKYKLLWTECSAQR